MLQKYFLKIFLSVFLLKLFLLFWSAHPFDFWSFVFTIQKYTLYNWNIFDYWNKGNFLIFLWMPLYSLYLMTVQLFQLSVDNIPLLHFFFKIPFLFMDVFCWYLLYKIILKLSDNSSYAKIGFLLWFINPIVYYVYGIHGHYELLTVFWLLLMVFWLAYNKAFLGAVGFVLWFTTKYFFVIFLPFIILYYIFAKENKNVYKFLAYTLLLTTLSYVHFFFDSGLFLENIKSILTLSHSHSTIGVTEIKLQPTNIFSAINFLFHTNHPISNISNKELFGIAMNGLFTSGLLLIIYFIYRFFQYKKVKAYPIHHLIRDIFTSLIIFLIFLSNFQPHYLIYLVPFFILYAFIIPPFGMLLVSYTVASFIYQFRGEIGTRTFFLDITNQFTPSWLADRTSSIVYLEWAVIILILILSLFLIVYPKEFIMKRLHYKTYVIFISILWVLIIIPFIQIISYYFTQREHENILAYQRDSGYHSGIIFWNYWIDILSKKEIVFSNSNQYGSLILSELPKLNTEEKDRFKLFLLNKDDLDLTGNRFNSCQIGKLRNGIFNFLDHHYYSGYELDIWCTKNINNTIYLNESSKQTFHNWSVELFITNTKVDYLYIKSKELSLVFLWLVGVFYLLSLSVFALILVRSIALYKEDPSPEQQRSF